jgi:hypothetical protein
MPFGVTRMNKKLLSLSAVVIPAILVMLSGGCGSIPIDDQAINFQEQYNELGSQLAVTQQQLDATRQQLSLAQQQLNAAQQQLADSQRRLADAQNQISTSSTANNYYSSEAPAYYPGCSMPGHFPYHPPCPVPSPVPPSPSPSPWDQTDDPWHYLPVPPQRHLAAVDQGCWRPGFYDLNEIY